MTAKEIINQIIHGLPLFRKEWSTRHVHDKKVKEVLRDKRTHMLATCMALYPTTPTNKIAKEFGISPETIRAVANVYGVRKEKWLRSVINRQNGNTPHKSENKAVVKVDADGNIVATFKSISEASRHAECSHCTISYHCHGKHTTPINGYYYKFANP